MAERLTLEFHETANGVKPVGDFHRARAGTHITRALFFCQAGKIVIATNGFDDRHSQLRVVNWKSRKRREDCLLRVEKNSAPTTSI